METQSCEKVANKYCCENCHYYTSRKSSYDKHILSNKHLANTIGDKKDANLHLMCHICNKKYKSRNGLWKHNKLCNINTETENENIVVDSSNNHIVQLLIKENSDFKNIIMELVKKIIKEVIINK